MALWGQGDPRWIVEERPDSTNVNNWHWTERDATTWSTSKLKNLFLNLKEETEEGSWDIEEVKTVTGEATINNRKGKLIYFYEWDITVNYKGTVAGSDSEHKGTINIPNLSDENSPDDVDVQIIAKGNAKNAEKLKHLVRKNGIKMCREICKRYVDDLKTEYSTGMVLKTKDEEKKNNENTNKSKCTNIKNNSNSDIKFTQDIEALSVKEPTSHNKCSNVEVKLSEEFHNMPANELFITLTQDARLCAFTRSQCVSNPIAGGEFSLMNGCIHGNYVEVVPNEKIVQKWRFKEWPENIYSLVTIKLDQKSNNTTLNLTHSGIPESDLVRTEKGWQIHFWGPIKQVFGFGRPLIS